MKNYTNEEWRDAVGYESYYQVSTWGRVKSLNYKRTGKEQILKPGKNKNGYLYVILSKNRKTKKFLVHRLVGMTFPDMVGWVKNAKGKPFEELEINHKKEGLKEKANNHVECLEWCDRRYNLEYGTHNKRVAKTLSKTVYQYTLDGELVKIWSSLHEVQRQTGWSSGNISECCNYKQKTAYGFLWRYAN